MFTIQIDKKTNQYYVVEISNIIQTLDMYNNVVTTNNKTIWVENKLIFNTKEEAVKKAQELNHNKIS